MKSISDKFVGSNGFDENNTIENRIEKVEENKP